LFGEMGFFISTREANLKQRTSDMPKFKKIYKIKFSAREEDLFFG
jgi:hypothetical protein